VSGEIRQEMSTDLLITAPTGWEDLSVFAAFDTVVIYDEKELLLQ